jgi:hypothetical protein
MNEVQLRTTFSSLGTYQPFPCSYCRERGNFVSGLHSHDCTVCGSRALWGWYTVPRCEAHRMAEQGGTMPDMPWGTRLREVKAKRETE